MNEAIRPGKAKLDAPMIEGPVADMKPQGHFCPCDFPGQPTLRAGSAKVQS
ncbi:MAG: hypothetical protein ACAH88_03710 [Roseimicrobium sp.]